MTDHVTFREGRTGDLRPAFGLYERAIVDTARRIGTPRASEPDEAEVEANWKLERPLVEFMVAQEGGSFWLAE